MLGKTEEGTEAVKPEADQASVKLAAAPSAAVIETKKRRPLREAMTPGSAKTLRSSAGGLGRVFGKSRSQPIPDPLTI